MGKELEIRTYRAIDREKRILRHFKSIRCRYSDN